MRHFLLTLPELLHALDRAAADDARWPNLHRHSWLVDHVKSVTDQGARLVTPAELEPSRRAELIRSYLAD